MRFVDDRTYAGTPGEQATVTTTLEDGGALSVTLDDVPAGNNPSFPLGPDGTERVLVLTLVGPEGASCTVAISSVDGATDVDLMTCRAAVPAPVHEYHFRAAAAAALPGAAKAARPAKKAAKKAARKAAKKTVKKVAKKAAKKTTRKSARPATPKKSAKKARPVRASKQRRPKAGKRGRK
jgi:hypothetical protein